jgi:hypothetical protein
MRNLFAIANEYLRQSDWKDLALIKFCLFSMGVLIGVLVPSRAKRPVIMASVCVFVLTYLPLMAKLFQIIFHRSYSKDF